jgi:hypothetical protein
MQSHVARISLLPSALVLRDLVNAHAGDPPMEALEQAGFRRTDISTYLQRRAGRWSCCTPNTGNGSGVHGA